MAALPWSDALALGLSFMDGTHEEFVDLLARCEAADDAATGEVREPAKLPAMEISGCGGGSCS